MVAPITIPVEVYSANNNNPLNPRNQHLRVDCLEDSELNKTSLPLLPLVVFSALPLPLLPLVPPTLSVSVPLLNNLLRLVCLVVDLQVPACLASLLLPLNRPRVLPCLVQIPQPTSQPVLVSSALPLLLPTVSVAVVACSVNLRLNNSNKGRIVSEPVPCLEHLLRINNRNSPCRPT